VRLNLSWAAKGKARHGADPREGDIAFALGGASPRATGQSGRQAHKSDWHGHLTAARDAALIRRQERLLMAWAGLTLALPKGEI
jgi:hypothetical protein